MMCDSWHRRRLLQTAAVAALMPLPLLGRNEVHELSGTSMGTDYRVRLTQPLSGSARSSLHRAIERTLGETDTLMSTYRADSEVMAFNRSQTTAWRSVSAATSHVIETALTVREQSLGAFDPSVAPLIDRWGFGATSMALHGADPFDDADAAPLSEPNVEVVSGRVRKVDPDVAINLNGIAKGDALDNVAALLDQAQVDDYLVELGGEIRVKGCGAGGEGWRVGIEHPDGGVHCVLALDQHAVATSGDYVHFYVVNGRRYCHIIDPRSLQPVAHDLSLVSVVADTAILADAWATALFVMGPREGVAYAQSHGMAALFLVRRGRDYDEIATPAFEQLVYRDRGQRA